MPPRRRRSLCPVSYSLDLFGDRWSLLILRDAIFQGKRHYRDFLEGGEGIATNVLADRLRRLEETGLLTKNPDPEDAKRFVYAVTEKGLDTLPILFEMIVWGARHDPQTPVSPEFVARYRRDPAGVMEEVRNRARAASSGQYPPSLK